MRHHKKEKEFNVYYDSTKDTKDTKDKKIKNIKKIKEININIKDNLEMFKTLSCRPVRYGNRVFYAVHPSIMTFNLENFVQSEFGEHRTGFSIKQLFIYKDKLISCSNFKIIIWDIGTREVLRNISVKFSRRRFECVGACNKKFFIVINETYSGNIRVYNSNLENDEFKKITEFKALYSQFAYIINGKLVRVEYLCKSKNSYFDHECPQQIVIKRIHIFDLNEFKIIKHQYDKIFRNKKATLITTPEDLFFYMGKDIYDYNGGEKMRVFQSESSDDLPSLEDLFVYRNNMIVFSYTQFQYLFRILYFHPPTNTNINVMREGKCFSHNSKKYKIESLFFDKDKEQFIIFDRTKIVVLKVSFLERFYETPIPWENIKKV